MTPEQKQRIAHEISNWNNAKNDQSSQITGDRMATLLQELIDEPDQAAGVPDGWRDVMQCLIVHIEELEAGANGLPSDFKWPSYVTKARAMLAAPQAPAVQADLVKDAERYRYLRACNSGSLMITHLIGIGDCDEIVLTGNDADEAIDAARAAEKGGAE